MAGKPTREQQDESQLAALAAFTARSFQTVRPVPFGAAIVETKTGRVVLRALNAVAAQGDPSLHAELRAVRLACKKLKTISLAGHTLYTTCEPCPMCMANALWAGLDRVVYGATIEDAARHCRQIYVPAKEVAERSDMDTIVEGPVLRAECAALFEHPVMRKALKQWNTRRRKR